MPLSVLIGLQQVFGRGEKKELNKKEEARKES